MILYHEASKDSVDQILKNGLKRTTHGAHSDDSSILRTDELLDRHRPYYIRHLSLSRQNNLYAYLGAADSIIDITTGREVPLKEYAKTSMALLVLSIDQSICYVSDLDQYDGIKKQLEGGILIPSAQLTAYWTTIVPLSDYIPGSIRRPEVLITKGIPSKNMSLVFNS